MTVYRRLYVYVHPSSRVRYGYVEASRSAGKGHGTGENQNGMLPVRTLDVVRKLYDRVQRDS